MRTRINRILAVATKEWRLNSRFPLEFFLGNLVTPLKSSILMVLLYSGFFRTEVSFFGNVTENNFVVYVLIGTVLHSQFSSSIGVFQGKMLTEKYWQTATGTLMTPLSVFELISGFMIGSGGLGILVNTFILTVISIFYPMGFEAYCLSIVVLFLLAFLGFGLGLIGGTFGLCWEGKAFLFDYLIQTVTFLSCFYYPIELLPKVVQNVVKVMPTYQLSHALHELHISGYAANLPMIFAYMVIVCFVVMIPSGYFFDHSVRKHGIVGY